MNSSTDSILERLAVCSWSLQPEHPDQLIEQLSTVGIPRIQAALDPVRSDPGVWGDLKKKCADAGISIVSGMFGTVGEDYSTLDSIRETGGVVPDATWDENWSNIRRIAEIASDMGLRFVSFHAGFLPHDESDPDFAKLSERIAQIADLFGECGIDLGCETGQETAETLRSFLEKMNRPNLGVNFDPANMLLYDKGDPVAALRELAPWLKQVHIKDATRTKTPGEWGEEVVVGTGEVDWKSFFKALDDLDYRGAFAIEREAGDQRVADIRTAREFINHNV